MPAFRWSCHWATSNLQFKRDLQSALSSVLAAVAPWTMICHSVSPWTFRTSLSLMFRNIRVAVDSCLVDVYLGGKFQYSLVNEQLRMLCTSVPHFFSRRPLPVHVL